MLDMVAHTFNLHAREAETGRDRRSSASLKPAWPTRQISGQPELCSKTLMRQRNKELLLKGGTDMLD